MHFEAMDFNCCGLMLHKCGEKIMASISDRIQHDVFLGISIDYSFCYIFSFVDICQFAAYDALMQGKIMGTD